MPQIRRKLHWFFGTGTLNAQQSIQVTTAEKWAQANLAIA